MRSPEKPGQYVDRWSDAARITDHAAKIISTGSRNSCFHLALGEGQRVLSPMQAVAARADVASERHGALVCASPDDV